MESELKTPEFSTEGLEAPQKVPLWLAIILGILPVALLAGAYFTFNWLMDSAPKAQQRGAPERNPGAVTVMPVQSVTRPTVISVTGTVVAARQIELRPRVAGAVIEIDPRFEPGGVFAEGEVMMRIDPVDYELAVAQREAELLQAEAAIRLEEGNQTVAKRELELVRDFIGDAQRDLVLREPQLRSLRAAYDRAQISLEQARLNLERTAIRAPFDCVIVSRDTNVGQQVATNTVLAEIAGTREFWVRATLPATEIRSIQFPHASSKASEARVYVDAAAGTREYFTGQVHGRAANLEAQGRLAQVYISIEDPLGVHGADRTFPLLLGSFVRTEILGKELQNVVELERRYLHEGDEVWVFEQGRLAVRPVEVVFRDLDTVVIASGLASGDRVITSGLAAPVPGMPLQLMQPQVPGGPPPPADNAVASREASSPSQAADASSESRRRESPSTSSGPASSDPEIPATTASRPRSGG